MQITLNGKPEELPDKITVATLLQQRNLANQACAVEVNQQLVPKREHADHTISDGDKVEIVTLVGGG